MSFPLWEINCWEEALQRFRLPATVNSSVPDRGCSVRLVPRMLTCCGASSLTVVDVVWAGNKPWCLQPRKFGVLCYHGTILLILTVHYYLQGPKWPNFYLPVWLIPHLFSLFSLSSAMFAILEHTSFIPDSGSLHCIRCFIAISFHVPSLHADLWWNLLLREGPWLYI